MTDADEPPSIQVALQLGNDLDAAVPLSEEDLVNWLGSVAHERGKPISLTARVVSSAESASLNASYRGRDRPTNVLSFPFDPPPGIDWTDPFVGDLALCAEVIDREAREQKKPARNHWAHMLIHGCLHLLGYDHQYDDDADLMESLEIRLLADLGIPDPYSPSGDRESG